MSESITVPDTITPAGADVPRYQPGSGNYFPKPPTKRRDKLGKYDIRTPKALIDKEENYVAVLTTGENRHPNEDEIIEHYARQQVAKKADTYNPLEDPPVVLRDLLPTLFVVVNKVFTQHEIVVGGEQRIIDYIEKLKEHVDLDLIPVMCGEVQVLPLHPLTPVKHRDPIYNAQMEGFYKQHDKSAKELIDRVVAAQEESNAKMEEQKKKEKEQAEQQQQQKQIENDIEKLLDEEDDEEETATAATASSSAAAASSVEKKGGARRVVKK